MNTLPLYLAALCLIPLVVGLVIFRAEQTGNKVRRAADVESAKLSAENKAQRAVMGHVVPAPKRTHSDRQFYQNVERLRKAGWKVTYKNGHYYGGKDETK